MPCMDQRRTAASETMFARWHSATASLRLPVSARHAATKANQVELSYTKEQQCKVLGVLNESTERELSQFLGASFVMRIMHHREQHGPFDSLESVTSVPGMRKAAILKVCERIVHDEVSKRKKAFSTIPVLSTDHIEMLNKVVSLGISPPYVTFASMDRNRNLVEWNHFVGTHSQDRRPTLPSLYQAATRIYEQLPQGDLFIIELAELHDSRQTSAHSKFKFCLKSMITAMLSFDKPMQPFVVEMTPRTVMDMFSLRVDNEQITCETVLRSCIKNEEMILTPELSERFNRANPVSREFLGRFALQCLAFWRMYAPE